ncbi:MAG: sensor histidine kinase [Xanthomonadales bacterium]|nr:sensor histidine kinase [Xanthomonadales bacterium]
MKSLGLRLRAWLLPAAVVETLGWMPMLWLAYLGFLFVLPVATGFDDTRMWQATVATVPPFLWLYFRAFRHQGWPLLPWLLAIAALSFVLTPFNPFGNSYLIYAAAFAPLLGSLARALAVLGVVLALYALQAWWLATGLIPPLIALLVGTSVCLANHFYLVKHRQDGELRLGLEEVRRLAAVAERERIGRDLHDLLGHTLSLIALKSELASRLLASDPAAAQAEVAQIEQVARDALAQVRRAVTGIRAAMLRPELASARLLLGGAGVELDERLDDGHELPPDIETCLALVLREAVTNVQRHARAARVEVRLWQAAGAVVLEVADDGRGGARRRGNGLDGMVERLAALGGSLEMDSPPGGGTRLRARVPLPATLASSLDAQRSAA